jgi:hypothetical protein
MQFIAETTEASLWGEVIPYWLAGIGAILGAFGTFMVAGFAIFGTTALRWPWLRWLSPQLWIEPQKNFVPGGLGPTPPPKLYYHLTVSNLPKRRFIPGIRAKNCRVMLERLLIKRTGIDEDFTAQYVAVPHQFVWAPFPIVPNFADVDIGIPCPADFGWIEGHPSNPCFYPAWGYWHAEEVMKAARVTKEKVCRFYLRVHAENTVPSNLLIIEVSWIADWDGDLEKLTSCFRIECVADSPPSRSSNAAA